ncbi:FHA domain-containing protein DDL [Cardamine amara subsp. amara]|uniref:FHA domain-containing protein DDL n=1 Tax=Cardamine amara subsp. amara TaxID=228776 RepID=A0ABD1AC96_CARAN
MAPSSRSPSPRTKRLRRVQDEKEVGRSREREDDKHNARGKDKRSSREVERERDRDREEGRDRDRERKREKSRDITDREVGDKRRRSGREETDERKRAGTDDERHSRGRHERSTSPVDRSHKSRRSPERVSASRHDEGSNARGGGEEPNVEEDSIARMRAAEEALAAKKKEEPSFELSGKLAEETNRYRGIPLLFNEPPEARKPSERWRLYVFKDGEPMNEPLYLHRQSCYLFGRERRIADVPTDHPSCSKQHAVIQYREIEKEKPDGTMGRHVRPYLMDLGSTNKTYINESAIEPQRYYELFEKDTIKFGNSSREYVLLHENSAE